MADKHIRREDAEKALYCPYCGAKMDGGKENG